VNLTSLNGKYGMKRELLNKKGCLPICGKQARQHFAHLKREELRILTKRKI